MKLELQQIIELKPCLFCGREEPEIRNPEKDLYFVTCLRCCCRGPQSRIENNVIEMWNEPHRSQIMNHEVRDYIREKFVPIFATRALYMGVVEELLRVIEGDKNGIENDKDTKPKQE